MNIKKIKVNPELCSGEETNKTSSYIAVKDLLKFQNVVLRVLGLYHHPNDSVFSKMYCMLTIFLSLYNLVRYFLLYNFVSNRSESFSIELLMKIVLSLFPIYCFLNGMFMYIVQQKKWKILKLDEHCEELFNKYQDVNRRQCKIKRFKFILIIITCTTLFIVCSLSSLALLSLFGDTKTRDFYDGFNTTLLYFEFDGKINTPYRIFVAIIMIFSGASCVCTASYYINYCCIMCKLLEDFNEAFKFFLINNILEFQDGSNYANEKGFEELRKWHLKLCDLIKILNDCFKYFILITLMINIPVIILILYITSDTNGCSKSLNKLALVLWTVVSFTVIWTVIFVASRINNKVCYLIHKK